MELFFIVQKMKFSIKDFFRKLRIWSHVLKKFLMENLIFFALFLENGLHRICFSMNSAIIYGAAISPNISGG